MQDTNLSGIISHMEMLNRITNAVALLKSALNRKVDIRTVGSEILQVNSEEFTQLLDFQTGEAISTLGGLLSTFQSAGGKQIENLYEKCDAARNLLRLIETRRSIFSNLNKLEPAKFFKWLEEKQYEKIFACNPDEIEAITTFYDEKTGSLAVLKSKSQKVLACLESIRSYGPDNAGSVLWTHYTNLNTTITIFLDIQEVLLIKTQLVDMSTDLSGIRTFLDKAKEVEKLLKAKTGQKLRNATIALFGKVSMKSSPLIYTMGLPNKNEDLIQIFDDLRTPWFRQMVAREQDIKEFETSLESFKNFTKNIQTLVDTWKEFKSAKVEEGKMDLLGTVDVVAELIAGIEKHDVLGKRYGNVAAPATQFETCYRDAALFTLPVDLLKIQTLAGKIYEQAYDMSKAATSINIHDKELLNQAIAFITFLKSDRETDMFALNKELKKWKSYSGFVKIASQIKKIYAVFQQFEATSKALLELNIDDLLNVSGAVTDSKAQQVLICFEQQKFDSKLVSDMYEFFRISKSFLRKANEVQGTIDFLKRLGKVQMSGSVLKEMAIRLTKKEANDPQYEPVHKLQNGLALTQHLVKGTETLKNIQTLLTGRQFFRSIQNIPWSVKEQIAMMAHESPDTEDVEIERVFSANNKIFDEMMSMTAELENHAGQVINGSLASISEIFEKAIQIPSFRASPNALRSVARQLRISDKREEVNTTADLLMNLSFVNLRFEAADLNSAMLGITQLNQFFEDVFHLNNEYIETQPNTEPFLSNFVVMIICIVTFTICLISLCSFYYGCTASGKTKSTNWYLYYFGKSEDFEKRWRYSRFLDRQDGKNALIDAVREVNSTNVLKALKRGAYVNVYNYHGNTPLHVATKRGYAQLVEILIKNGADRSLLNSQNRMPQQMIPADYGVTKKEKAGDYQKIEQIYAKYAKKAFRMKVPEVFPVSSFHIYIEDRTNNSLTNAFMDKFQSITSDEALVTTTHLIVKTDNKGVLETDQLELLFWIFNGVIIVRESWMTACLQDEELIESDCDYLVENVKYKGVIYSTVVSWTTAMAKGEMPFLHGVFVAVVMAECPYLPALNAMIHNHGGTLLDVFPLKENYNKGSHPYMHAKKGPLFIIHDGKTDLSAYKNEPLYSFFTEEQFMVFMLKKEVHRNTASNPIPVVNELDEF